MILSKTPFRLSFVGGGSDLPTHYQKYGGSVISTSINKYMYISVHKNFDNRTRVSYSRLEDVERVDNIKHPIAKNALKLFNVSGVEIASMADIPALGTGLGSSSSYAVGLCNCLTRLTKLEVSKDDLAKFACKIEIEMCEEPIGKQDQYSASFGNFNQINFNRDGSVDVIPISIENSFYNHLEKCTMFFYVGVDRTAKTTLNEQNERTKRGFNQNYLNEMVSFVNPFCRALSKGSLDEIASLLNSNWELKKKLSSNISNSIIDQAYNAAMKSGAIGGKLLGAGNGGFLMLLVPQNRISKVRDSLSSLRELPVGFDREGTKVVYENLQNIN